MSSNYDGEPLDLAWQSDLKDIQKERNGETIAGSSGEEDGAEKIEIWPSVLPLDAFRGSGSKQADVIRAFVQFPDADKQRIADVVGCHINTVRRSLAKASLFATPEQLPFEVPNRPQSQFYYLKNYVDHPDSRFTAEELDGEPQEASSSEDESGSTIDADEIARRYYEAESETAESIAEDFDLSESQVYGYLASADYEKPDPVHFEEEREEEPQTDPEAQGESYSVEESVGTDTSSNQANGRNTPAVVVALVALIFVAVVRRLIGGGDA